MKKEIIEGFEFSEEAIDFIAEKVVEEIIKHYLRTE